MITASMLILQGCTEDNIEFDHTIANGQKILKLNAQYYQYSCLEEFTKEINVVFIHGTYVLDGKKGSNFSFSELWNLLQDAEHPLPSNAVTFCTQMINHLRELHYMQAASSSILKVKTIKHPKKITMLRKKHRGGKILWWRSTERYPHLH